MKTTPLAALANVQRLLRAALLAAVLLLGWVRGASALRAATLVEIAAGNPEFSTLVAAVQAAGLVETLSGSGPFTVFAPNNAAFAKLPAGTVEALLANPARLRQLLLYHVVSGNVRSTALVPGSVPTVQGAAVRVDLTSGVRINDSRVISADVDASNGVIHVIDNVLLPPPSLVERVASSPSFSTLLAAVQAAGLADFLGSSTAYTVFAPDDAAFAKLPPGTVEALVANPARLRQVLLYHVVPGRVRSTALTGGTVPTVQGAAVRVDLTAGVRINDSRVVAADIESANGVVHVIDKVLLPPPDLVDTALSSPRFSTLVTALQAAGLVEALRSPGPFTVFAPDNDAFAKLPPGTLGALLADTNRLRHILLYHVHSGPRVRARDLQAGPLSTLQGAPVQVSLTDGARINQARVTTADVEAGNGVIHVINEVILPGGGFQGPDLRISMVVLGETATVVWPASVGTGAVLESSVSPSGPWTAVPATRVTADGISKVSLPAAAAAQFFRLRTE